MPKQEDSTLNRQFEDFTGFYGSSPSNAALPWIDERQVKRTVQFMKGNFIIGSQYKSLADPTDRLWHGATRSTEKFTLLPTKSPLRG